MARRCLSERERELLLAIAETAMPAGLGFPAADMRAVRQVEHFIAGLPPNVRRGYRATIASIDAAAMLGRARRFTALPPTQRLAILERWRTGGRARRFALRAILSPLKVAHFGRAELFEAVGCVFRHEPPATLARPRHVVERTHAGSDLDQDTELHCDVVVVGSGAGGAVVAKELAERGHAVVLLEEGAYFDRSDFNGRAFEMQRKMYRSAGATFALGSSSIPLPTGRTVGGTTTVNSGTCYRAPARVLASWSEDHGLTELAEAQLAPYYDRVEATLGVEPARPELLGGVARVIARGCDRLGYRHGPLRRNAPDCDGKGVCCFGCPTDAKRSTNVSYVPLALRAGAELFHGVRVTRIETEGDRVCGVEARAVNRRGQETTTPRALSIRSRVVVIACGALNTPLLLLRNGLCNRSGELGRNLTVHPAVASMALFPERIVAPAAIPQGYAIEEFGDEGILFEGAGMPLDVGMAASPLIGPALTELAERFADVAMFGFLVEDSGCGRVRLVRGRPLVTYSLTRRDVARLKRGHDILARVFFAAGARAVLPMIHGFDRLETESDLMRLRRATLRASDFETTAYHPLGTARMGLDPERSVVDPCHEAHDHPGLYVVDGSIVPSSLGVNPQLTIMALATRAANCIDRALRA